MCMNAKHLTNRSVLTLSAISCIAALSFVSGQPANAQVNTTQGPIAVSAAAETLTGTYRVNQATVSYHGATYTLEPSKSALLITNGYDGGQTANLDAVTTFKGVAVPLAIVHSTGGIFPNGVEESAPGCFELGNDPTPRAEGVGTIELHKSGRDLDYRATVPLGDGTSVHVTANAVLDVPSATTR